MQPSLRAALGALALTALAALPGCKETAGEASR